ncbi:protein kinase [Nonomuraea sp. PA05]|uniref:serine/threonine-protein kinase n=1 Tax=Nonomuraea sp. PA05 TaxID=2604466 RepID=UPI0011D458CF|nr:serine/threonine-protein kinase [Nonomuraea sp. PA05]TYB71054.1 protein kinase [Nonomuraea sp. PA05]
MTSSALVAGDPARVGAYALAGRLGAGGQGVVYEAYGPSGERVAVKVLHAASAGLRPPDGEVAALSRVAPFCTARIVDFDLAAERPYIVSEFVPGPSLRAAVQRHGPLRGDQLHRLAVGVATALVAVHRAGVVHRDLKPDNVLLGPDGPRVIDFGIARLLTGSVTSGTRGAVGTPLYMAPEVLRGVPAGPEADVYGWAAVLLYAASGRPPYRAQAHTVEFPEPLRSLVPAGLAERPEDRPTARDLLLSLLERRADRQDLAEAGNRAAGAVGSRDDPVEPPLGERAELVFAALPEPVQAAVPGILVRLAGPGDQLRSAALDELGDDPAVPAAVEALCRASFLTATGTSSGTGAGTEIRIAAPALPVAWPRLRGWLAEERPGLADHERLRDAARAWAAHGRKDADLHQGSALERDNRWAGQARRNLRLNGLEREFLAASAALAGRRRRRRRLSLITLAVLLAVTAVLGTVAETQRRVVTAQRDEAIARRLAARVPELRLHAPSTALSLSVAAWRVSPVPEARVGLLASLGQADVSTGIDGEYVAVPGGHVLTWNGDGATVRDPASRETLGRVRSPRCCAGSFLSPDASLLVALDSTQFTTRLFDVRGGGLRRELDLGGNDAVFNARGDRAVILTHQSDRPVSVIDLPDGALVASLNKQNVTAVALSPDGGTLALADVRHRVELVDLASGRATRTIDVPLPAGEQEPYHGQVSALRFTPDGRTLLTHDAELRFWDAGTGAERTGHPGAGQRVDDFALDAGGRWLASVADDAIRLLDLRTSRQATVVFSLPSQVEELAFTGDARGLAYTVRPGGVRYADLSSYTAPPRLSGLGEEATHAALAVRAGRAATYGPDGVRAWDLATRRQVGPAIVFAAPSPGAVNEPSPCAELPEHVFQGVSLSPDGTRLAAVTPDGAVRVSDVATGRELARLLKRPPRRRGDLWEVSGVGFGPDGKTIAVSATYSAAGTCRREPVVQLWTAAPSWRLAHTTSPARGPFAFLPDGRRLVVLDDDGLVLVDAGSGKIVRRVGTGDIGIALDGLAPDPRYALTGVNALYLADLTTGRLVEPPLIGDSGVELAASSPDGRTLATVDSAQRVRVRDTSTGQAADLPFPGGAGPVLALAFSADGATLHALTSDGVLFAHTTDAERAAALLCARVGGSPPAADWSRYVPELPYRKVC